MKKTRVGHFIALSTAALLVLAVKTATDLRPLPDSLTPVVSEGSRRQITDRAGAPLSVSYQGEWNLYDVVPLHETPELLRHAFVVAEDQRFFQHAGVDWIARLHALAQNARSLRAVRGASTITEQVVRILHPRPRTFWSRWLEGIEAGRLEARFGKTEILEFYLNQVPYARQRRGIAQAARDYFSRDLDTLSDKEMLALAVLPRSPSRLDLIKGVAPVEIHVGRLAERLEERGLLTAARLEALEHAPLELAREASRLEAAHFEGFVRDRLEEDESPRPLRTTLDGSLQTLVRQLLDQRVESLASRRVADGAALVVDHEANEILAWVNAGGLSDREGAHIDKVTMPRQPGSALKPFVYALALERGWTAATLIDDSPLAEPVGHGRHRFRNYSRSYYGPIRLREALGNSLNVPAVLAAQYTGRAELLARLHALGFASLTQHSDYYGDGLALGNGEVTLYEMVQAYATLARGGRFEELSWVFDSPAGATDRRVFDPEVSSIIADILSDPDARRREFGTGSVLDLPIETAVKTGTSNDYHDAWALGFSDRYTIGVWMGNVDRRPMHEITGSMGPALVLRAIFAEVRRNQESRPLRLSRELTAQDICTHTGRLPTSACPTTREWFLPGSVPTTTCSTHSDLVVEVAMEAVLRLESPTPGLHIALDPRIPDELERFVFRLTPGPDAKRVEWILDERIVAATDVLEPASSTYFWPPARGSHTARARVWREGVDAPLETEPVAFVVK